jgi:zinc protease
MASSQPRLPEHYFWQRLDNGLEVIVIENNKVPLATIMIAVKNGAFTEGPEYSGLSHLFEHMFFKANQDYPTQELLLHRTQELGAIWNGTTSTERVNYYFTFYKDSLEAGLKFMNAAIRFPIYRPEDMQKERLVVDGEFQRGESSPTFQLNQACQKKLWGDLFTRKNPIGDHNIINTATPEKMMYIKGKYYHPNNSLLVICGDVQHEQAFALAKKVYGDWPNSGFDPFQKYPIPEFTPLASTEFFVMESTIARTPYAFYMWQGPDYRNDSAGTIAADVFSTLLNLNSSKWQQALIDKGLATVANVSYQSSRYVGPINIFVIPNPNKLKECNEQILAQIKMWGQADYFSDEQLENAKQIMRRQKIRQNEKPSSLPNDVTFWWCSTSLDYFTDYLDDCMKVTRSDIQKYIARYVTGKPFVAGMIISPDMNKKLGASDFFKPSF